jgi:hypothetical protein
MHSPCNNIVSSTTIIIITAVICEQSLKDHKYSALQHFTGDTRWPAFLFSHFMLFFSFSCIVAQKEGKALRMGVGREKSHFLALAVARIV